MNQSTSLIVVASPRGFNLAHTVLSPENDSPMNQSLDLSFEQNRFDAFKEPQAVARPNKRKFDALAQGNASPRMSPHLNHFWPSPSPSPWSPRPDSRMSYMSDSDYGKRSDEEVDEAEYRKSIDSLKEIMSKSFDPKRAFEYNFINQMKTIQTRVLKSAARRFHKPINFKLLATSLDAGTKVYISKVEKTYLDTKRMSTFLDLAVENETRIREEVENVEKKSRAKVRPRQQSKIAKDKHGLMMITFNSTPPQSELDLFFYKLTTSFKEHTDLMLIDNLRMNSRGVLLFDSRDVLHCDQDQQIECLPMRLPVVQLDSDPFTCKHFSEFEFSQRDIDLSQVVPSGNVNIAGDALNSYAFDVNSQVEDVPAEECILSNFEPSISPLLNESVQDLERTLNVILPSNQVGQNGFFNRKFLKAANLKSSRNNFNKRQPIANSKRKGPMFHEPNDYRGTDEDKFARRQAALLSFRSTQRWQPQSLKERDYGFQPFMLRSPFVYIRNCHTFADLLLAAQESRIDLPYPEWDGEDSEIEMDVDYNSDQGQPPNQNIDDEYIEESQHEWMPNFENRPTFRRRDFRLIKRAIKRLINFKLEETAKLNIDSQSSHHISVEMTFEDVISDLNNESPQNSQININSLFVTLLHVCNEQNLVLSRGLQNQIVISKV